MYRRFDFEGDVHESLSCVPLAVRRKLDLAGSKISLAGWVALPRDERLALCHLPVDGEGDVAIYREVLSAFAARAGVELKPLAGIDASSWSKDSVPMVLSAALDRARVKLDLAAWRALTEEERYCLVKYSDDRHAEKLALLAREVGLSI